jgi:hypothetical protein
MLDCGAAGVEDGVGVGDLGCGKRKRTKNKLYDSNFKSTMDQTRNRNITVITIAGHVTRDKSKFWLACDA